jgi:NitT/TauT family transport system ATP-binding protein
MDQPSKIVIRNLTKSFVDGKTGRSTMAVCKVHMNIQENEFVTIIGPSGCGKTTLLNMVAGFIEPTDGEIWIDGKRVQGPGGGKGMVFQQFALFPWASAVKNIEFGLKVKGMGKEERQKVARQLIELVNLQGFEDRYPYELSGGMQQRVAIARALAIDPAILLMDEPFGALDDQTRILMQNELLRIWSTAKKTVIFVTHSIPEAIALSDRIVVMRRNPGTIQEEFVLNLPRPRMRRSSEFVQLYMRLQNAIGQPKES